MRALMMYGMAAATAIVLSAAGGTTSAEAAGCSSGCAPKRCYSCKPKPKPEPTCYKCFKKKVTPATYRTVTEKKLVTPERTEYKVVPPTFKYEKEKILVSAARTEWVMKHGLKCEITIPAKYKYEMKKIQIGWEQRIPYTIPAVYTTVSRQELVTPASESWMQVKQGCGSCGHGGYAATTPPPVYR
jgi:hypothetical protein